MFRAIVLCLILAALAGGCSAPPAKEGFEPVEKMLAERSTHRVEWNHHSADDAAVCEEVKQLLAQPLDAEAVVQIALLNNRSLQATYEEIGIAQADLVQAGLLTNPKFFASVRFPNHGPASPDAEFSVAADFLELLMVPLRKQVAADKLAASQRRICGEVLEMEHQARVAAYMYESRMQSLALQRTILESQDASVEVARRQHQAGNISDLDLASEEANYAGVKLDVARTEAQSRADREELNRLMGLWGTQSASWQVVEKLPELPKTEPVMDHVESLAIRQRVDLDASRLETLALARALGMTEQFRLTGIELGIDVERRDKTEGYVGLIGPQLSVEVPIFDQKQAQVARMEAAYRQSLDRLTALAIEIRSQVRSARDRVNAAREIATFYQTALLPQRQQVTRLTGLHYNGMLIGVDRWLMARASETAAYREYIEAVRDYWIAKSDLERAVGSRLGDRNSP